MLLGLGFASSLPGCYRGVGKRLLAEEPRLQLPDALGCPHRVPRACTPAPTADEKQILVPSKSLALDTEVHCNLRFLKLTST